MYTDWLFLPLCAMILLYRLLRRRDIRATSSAFLWQIALPATLALTLFFLQLFWVLGPHFVPALLERFLVRSMDTTAAFHGHSMLWHVYGYFLADVGAPTIALTVLALVLLCIRPQIVSSPLKDFLVLLFAPSVVLLLIFRQHAAVHSFTIVKFMIPIFVVLGSILPRALVLPHKQRVFALLCSVFFLYEGWQYLISVGVPVDRQALAWEETVRGRFGYHDVLFTPEPIFEIPESPTQQLARSRKRIYQYDAERVAQLQRTISEARIFLIGTAGAIDAHCPEKQTLSSSLYYCRLCRAHERSARSIGDTYADTESLSAVMGMAGQCEHCYVDWTCLRGLSVSQSVQPLCGEGKSRSFLTFLCGLWLEIGRVAPARPARRGWPQGEHV